MLKFYKELKRRNVIKTLGVYGAAAIVITTTAATLFPYLLLPAEAITFVIVLAILGFPVAFFFSWIHDLKLEADTDDKSGYKDAEPDNRSKKILLPLTGILTIIGGAFWGWYSLGDVTSGSDLDLQMGIKKSVAVLNFDNLSGDNEGNFI
ncbi:MAG TPA: hypothetical protein QF698_01430, partial [Candidatus Marinimicrobia bacterium]|nr:hypothetical protein [Candidatus Neomarinimicrobiota bacterium]